VSENLALRKIFGPERRREDKRRLAENVIMKSFIICTSGQILLHDSIEDGVMDWICSTHGRQMECKQKFRRTA
jgi:hypothetical protein